MNKIIATIFVDSKQSQILMKLKFQNQIQSISNMIQSFFL